MKENKQKGKRHWGAGEVDKGGERNPRVEKRNKKNRAGMATEKWDQEREALDKLPYATVLLIRGGGTGPAAPVLAGPLFVMSK